jgi:hypothetical protein
VRLEVVRAGMPQPAARGRVPGAEGQPPAAAVSPGRREGELRTTRARPAARRGDCGGQAEVRAGLARAGKRQGGNDGARGGWGRAPAAPTRSPHDAAGSARGTGGAPRPAPAPGAPALALPGALLGRRAAGLVCRRAALVAGGRAAVRLTQPVRDRRPHGHGRTRGHGSYKPRGSSAPAGPGRNTPMLCGRPTAPIPQSGRLPRPGAASRAAVPPPRRGDGVR